MHCPKCGTSAAESQRFCRACGFSLEKVASLLAESAPSLEPGFSEDKSNPLQKRLNRMDKIWRMAVTTLGATFLTAICWAIVHFVIIGKNAPVIGALFLLFILGMVALGLSAAYLESQREKLTKLQKRQPSIAPDSYPEMPLPAETTNKILPEPELSSFVSITEETTAHLAEKNQAAQ